MVFFFGAAEGGMSLVDDAPGFGNVKFDTAKIAVDIDSGFAVFGLGIFKISFDAAKIAL